MSQEERRGEVVLSIFLLQPFDPEEALSVAESLAKKHGGRFNGILLSGLPTYPPSMANNLTFVIRRSAINGLIHDMMTNLGVDEKSIRFTIVSAVGSAYHAGSAGEVQPVVPVHEAQASTAMPNAALGVAVLRPHEVGLLKRTWGAPISIGLSLLLLVLYFLSPTGTPGGTSNFLTYAFYLFLLSAGLLGSGQLRYSQRTRSYLKKNWGSPFVVGFMLLLIASAVELSSGSVSASSVANDWAVYAFYLLVLGVALQIASYVKYGEQDSALSSPLAAEIRSGAGEGGPESQTSARGGPSNFRWWKRPVLFGGFAYFWSLVNDRPVNADQVLGPQGQLAMELVLHVLVAAFLVLSIRSALRHVEGPSDAVPRAVYPLAALAFILSSWDDFAFPGAVFLDVLRHDYWYPATVSAHLASVVLLFFAVRLAHRRGRA